MQGDESLESNNDGSPDKLWFTRRKVLTGGAAAIAYPFVEQMLPADFHLIGIAAVEHPKPGPEIEDTSSGYRRMFHEVRTAPVGRADLLAIGSNPASSGWVSLERQPAVITTQASIRAGIRITDKNYQDAVQKWISLNSKTRDAHFVVYHTHPSRLVLQQYRRADGEKTELVASQSDVNQFLTTKRLSAQPSWEDIHVDHLRTVNEIIKKEMKKARLGIPWSVTQGVIDENGAWLFRTHEHSHMVTEFPQELRKKMELLVLDRLQHLALQEKGGVEQLFRLHKLLPSASRVSVGSHRDPRAEDVAFAKLSENADQLLKESDRFVKEIQAYLLDELDRAPLRPDDHKLIQGIVGDDAGKMKTITKHISYRALGHAGRELSEIIPKIPAQNFGEKLYATKEYKRLIEIYAGLGVEMKFVLRDNVDRIDIRSLFASTQLRSVQDAK